MRIKVRLSQKGIKQAQRELHEYRQALNSRLQEFVRRLTLEGYEVAKLKFSAAAYDGDNDVTVRVEQNGTKARIIASGKSVLFIEFGTGTTHAEHPSGMFAHGTFGKGYGDSNKYPHGWVYSGPKGTGGLPVLDKDGNERPGVYRTKGNPPAEAMWGAVTKMAESVERIWREVMS